MITKISENGVLAITPTNELESFALRQWGKSFQSHHGCSLELHQLNGANSEVIKEAPLVSSETREGLNLERINEENTALEKQELFNKTMSDLNELRVAPSKTNNIKKPSEKNSTEITIPRDKEVRDFLKTQFKPLSCKQISFLMNESGKHKIKTYQVSNSLNRLLNADVVTRNENHKPITWIYRRTKKPKNKTTSNALFYASDLDRINFAKEKGFKTIDAAITEMGSWAFESQLKAWSERLT